MANRHARKKIAAPMTMQDRSVLRSAILSVVKESGPTTLEAISAGLKMSSKRVYRELRLLQETATVRRIGEGRATRYGIRAKRWGDDMFTPPRPKPPTPPKSVAWWVGLSREQFNETIRKKNDWTSIAVYQKGDFT